MRACVAAAARVFFSTPWCFTAICSRRASQLAKSRIQQSSDHYSNIHKWDHLHFWIILPGPRPLTTMTSLRSTKAHVLANSRLSDPNKLVWITVVRFVRRKLSINGSTKVISLVIFYLDNLNAILVCALLQLCCPHWQFNNVLVSVSLNCVFIIIGTSWMHFTSTVELFQVGSIRSSDRPQILPIPYHSL